MVLRLTLLALGVLELLRPRKVVDFWMGLATTEADDIDLRPWVYSAARVEGALLVLWVLRQRRSGE
ncbi:hypothetical protein BVU17_13615 [Haloarcula taiwanensis]|uniref:Uncharacterized protein n=1 Tax=Haloarcula taiwanensis TaxID=1932004 RepID=A0A2H5A1F4_9EURY|nr:MULTISPECIES: hypothetical protein [Haloarcula]AUG48510.1 hypothetical protein BVU17_13615 [Haloarcula taiwanensis]RLM39863.1 hypothetical protein DVK01_04705 [Haloarcula sp. Atlit-120R]RLM47853.1 hypothetical protein DVK00_04945 [Haloarcula sp. Atlit-47R]